MDFGQTKYTDGNTGKQMILPFPAELLKKLIAENGMDVEHLTVSDVKKLFPILVGRWLDGSVQTEELSSIAIFFISVTKYENEELTSVLLASSELSYFIRYTNSKTGEPLHGFVAKLRAYYASSNPET